MREGYEVMLSKQAGVSGFCVKDKKEWQIKAKGFSGNLPLQVFINEQQIRCEADAAGRLTLSLPCCADAVTDLGGHVFLCRASCDSTDFLWRCRQKLKKQTIKKPPDEKMPEAPLPEKETEKTQAYLYKEASDTAPVDDLPSVTWPQEAQKLAAYFEMERPESVTDTDSAWRYVRVRTYDKRYPQCLIGRCIKAGRVIKTAYILPSDPRFSPQKGYQRMRGRDGRLYDRIEITL